MEKIYGYFAWLDILGFKNIMKRNPKYLGNYDLLTTMSQFAACHFENIKGSKDKHEITPNDVNKRVKVRIISDTFIMYTNETQEEDLKNILYAVWDFLPNGFVTVDEDLALRGAISKGEIEIRYGSNSIIDSFMLVQGKAASEAVELESTLKAGVCLLSEDIVKDIGDQPNKLDTRVKNKEGIYNPIKKWFVPVKEKGKIIQKESFVINWPESPIDISCLPNKFERMIKYAEGNDAKNIAFNTKEFYNSIKENRAPKYEGLMD